MKQWIPLLVSISVCVAALALLVSCELLETGVQVVQDPAVQDAGRQVVTAIGTGNPVTVGFAILSLVNSIWTAVLQKKTNQIDEKRSVNAREHFAKSDELTQRVTALESRVYPTNAKAVP